MDFLQTHWTYALILGLSLLGLVVADWRWQLIAFGSSATARRRATLLTLLIMVVAFLVWDICGIGLGIFSTNPHYVLGIFLISHNLPIEEVAFLTLLTYVSLLVVTATARYNRRLDASINKALKK